VRFVDENDRSYGISSDTATQASLMQQGKISFRTCFKSVMIPASYILKLASKPYSPFHTFKNAVEDWLLRETLGAIGHYTVM